MPRLPTLRGLHVVCPGEIPAELGSLSNLGLLDVHYNLLIGEIPSELGDLDNLTSLGGLDNLTSLNLAENQLSGKIPAWLADVGESSGSVKLYSNEFECAPSSLKGWVFIGNVPDCGGLTHGRPTTIWSEH